MTEFSEDEPVEFTAPEDSAAMWADLAASYTGAGFKLYEPEVAVRLTYDPLSAEAAQPIVAHTNEKIYDFAAALVFAAQAHGRTFYGAFNSITFEVSPDQTADEVADEQQRRQHFISRRQREMQILEEAERIRANPPQ